LIAELAHRRQLIFVHRYQTIPERHHVHVKTRKRRLAYTTNRGSEPWPAHMRFFTVNVMQWYYESTHTNCYRPMDFFRVSAISCRG